MRALVLLTLALPAQLACGGARLQARIVDDADGRPLAARVCVTDVDGKPLEIAGPHAHAQHPGRRWCYADGAFSVAVPARRPRSTAQSSSRPASWRARPCRSRRSTSS